MSRLGNILKALANIGKTYSAAWTATSTSGTTPLTNSITLPKGVYLVVASSPYVSGGAAAVMELRINGEQQADKLISAPVGNYTKGAFIIELDSQSTIQLYSGGTQTTNYQVIERGSLKAARIKGGGILHNCIISFGHFRKEVVA